MTGVVLDASFAAAFVLADAHSDAVEAVIGAMAVAVAPPLFWHEMRNILLVAERRGRIAPGEALVLLALLRRLPLEEAETSDAEVLALAQRHGLSGYNAAYLALAAARAVPLATLDRRLAEAAGAAAVKIAGPLSA